MERDLKNYIPENEITGCGKLIKNIMFKPKAAPIVCTFFAILLILIKSWISIALAIFTIVMVVYVALKVKDYKTISIYDNCIVLYDTHQTDLARKIDYSDVVEWTVKASQGASDALMLKLNTGEIIYKDSFQVSSVYRELNKLMPERESRAIQAEKNKQSSAKFKFRFPKFKKK